jgi:hypothetical protein
MHHHRKRYAHTLPSPHLSFLAHARLTDPA